MQAIWDWLLNVKDARVAQSGGYLTLTHPWPIWLAVLGTIAVILAVIFVYRKDGGTTMGKAIGGTLRALLLVFLLLLIWQPVIRIDQEHREPGVVAVLVDISRSMNSHDPYGLDDPIVTDFASADATGKPASQPAGREVPLDPAAQAAALKRVLDKSRLQLVGEMLNQNHREALHALLANNDVLLYRFAKDRSLIQKYSQKAVGAAPGAADAKNSQDAQDAQLGADMAALTKDTPTANATDVAGAITGVLNDLRGKRLAGVIVISDGRTSVGEAAGAQDPAELAGRFPVPIHTVIVGSIHPPRHVVVSQLVAEPTVFVRDWVAAKILIRQVGLTGPEKAMIRLVKLIPNRTDLKKEDWDKLPEAEKYSESKLAEQEITLGEQEKDPVTGLPGKIKREIPAELRFKPDKEDKFLLAARVELLSNPEPGKAANWVTMPIDVRDTKIKVLLIDGLPRWEYRFAVNSLKREKTVQLTCWLMAADEDFAQDGTPGCTITHLPQAQRDDAQPLNGWDNYDVVLLGDVSPLDLTGAAMEKIESFVKDRAGGFAMIAGENFAPNRYGTANNPIGRMLPVEIDPNPGQDRVNRVTGFKMRLRPEGESSPILRFEELPAQNLTTIGAFPDFYWYKTIVSVKPGAEVLAEHPTVQLADGKPAPLFVCSQYGAGRTFFAATDETWRWRYHTGTPYFDTYWLQLVRYLSRNKLLDTDVRFNLSADQTVYDRGQPVSLTVQVRDPKLVDLPDVLKVRVSLNGVENDSVYLRKTGRSYVGQFQPTTEGNWVFELDKQTLDQAFGSVGTADRQQRVPEAQVHVTDNSPEDMDLSIDDETFPRLAVRTHGRSGTLASLADIARQVPDKSQTEQSPIDHELWSTRLALFIFALLITAEWILRKKYNLQ
jgi:hypothetical protein